MTTTTDPTNTNTTTTTTNPITGSCNCGAVAYAMRQPWRFFQYCHCSRCRKRSGSAHAANIAVLVDQFEWTNGEEHIKRWEMPSAKSWSTCWCDACGSSLPWKTKNGKAFIVPAGTLDVDPVDRPARNIHFASKAVWYAPAASLPHFDGEPT